MSATSATKNGDDRLVFPSDACAICLRPISTPCGHTFHTGCIDAWTCRTPSCPTCRTRLENRDGRAREADQTIVRDIVDVKRQLAELSTAVSELAGTISFIRERVSATASAQATVPQQVADVDVSGRVASFAASFVNVTFEQHGASSICLRTCAEYSRQQMYEDCYALLPYVVFQRDVRHAPREAKTPYDALDWVLRNAFDQRWRDTGREPPGEYAFYLYAQRNPEIKQRIERLVSASRRWSQFTQQWIQQQEALFGAIRPSP